MDEFQPIEFNPGTWVNIPPLVTDTFGEIIEKINSFSDIFASIREKFDELSQDVEQRVGAMGHRLEVITETTQKATEGNISSITMKIDSELEKVRSLVREGDRRHKEALDEAIVSSKEETETRLVEYQENFKVLDDRIRSQQEDMQVELEKIAQSRSEIDEKIAGAQQSAAQVKIEIEQRLASDTEALSKRISECMDSTKENRMTGEELSLRMEAMHAMITGNKEELQNIIDRTKERVERDMTDMNLKLKEDVDEIVGETSNTLRVEFVAELETEIHELEGKFEQHMKDLADVQSEDIEKLRQNVREWDAILMKTLREEFASSLSTQKSVIEEDIGQVDTALRTMLKEASNNAMRARKLLEESMHDAVSDLRTEILDESSKRQEEDIALEQKMRVLFEKSSLRVSDVEEKFSKVQPALDQLSQEVDAKLEENQTALKDELQYMQKNLSRMLNESNGPHFSRISEARFYALETRLKQEENMRLSEQSRLVDGLSHLSTIVKKSPSRVRPFRLKPSSTVAHLPTAKRSSEKDSSGGVAEGDGGTPLRTSSARGSRVGRSDEEAGRGLGYDDLVDDGVADGVVPHAPSTPLSARSGGRRTSSRASSHDRGRVRADSRGQGHENLPPIEGGGLIDTPVPGPTPPPASTSRTPSSRTGVK